MEPILIGTTDRTILVFIPDPASTTGAGKTGLAAAAVTVTYTRVETDNDVVHSDVTSSVNDLSALTDAHNDWGWKEVSSTLSKGLYRLDVADAVFASGAWYAVVQVTITSGTAAATPKLFRLVAYNELDGVRLGLTALPNAAAEASGGLYTRGTGAGQIGQTNNGTVDVRLADGVAHGGTLGSSTATLALSRLNVTSQTSNTAGVTVAGNGSGAGFSVTGGATGDALKLVGGGTSGNGLTVTATSGHGLSVTATGASKHGVVITGGDSGTSDGLKLVAGTGGVGFRLDTLTASGAVTLSSTLTVSGATSLAALSTSGTATFNALTVSNATTLSGAVSLGSTLGITGTTTLAALTTTGTVTFNAFTPNFSNNSITAASLAADAGGEIADAVWDEAQSGHTTAGTFGKYLDAAVSGVSTGGVSAADIATAVWQDLLAGSDFSTAGSIGKLLKDDIDAAVSSRLASASISLSGGAVTVGTNNDKTGYSVSGTTTTLDALQTALNSAHGAGSWATATGFSTHSASDVWAVGTRVLTAGTNIQLPSNGLANVTAWTVNITGNITGNLSGSVGSVTTKTGYSLASTGLDLVVPADPSAEPVLGTASIVSWIGFFGAWSVNKVLSDSDSVNLRNTNDNADITSHATSDNGTTFTSGAAT